MSQTHTLDYRGSPLCAQPLSRHEFAAHPNDFPCSVCHQPRALHTTPDHPTIPSNLPPGLCPIRTASFSLALRTHVLTDRDIARYQAQGYYTAEFREARRQLWEKRHSRRREPPSNFVSHDGRLIYCPS